MLFMYDIIVEFSEVPLEYDFFANPHSCCFSVILCIWDAMECKMMNRIACSGTKTGYVIYGNFGTL